MSKVVSRIKIGLDFHGVITDNPTYFSKFTQEAITRGYEIHIITGGPADVVKVMLDEWKINYTTIFAILDFSLWKGAGPSNSVSPTVISARIAES